MSKNNVKIKRALISVSDKTGLAEFAKVLHGYGAELVSTSGTAKFLAEAGLPVRDLSDVTKFPEMLDGRVKTLHPKVHGALLYRRDTEAHVKAAREHGIEDIDMVVVNLYPFRETAAKAKESFAPEVIENIDIGGPSMLRSAAKNFASVAVVCRAADYASLTEELNANDGALGLETRRRLAVEAFTHTAAYDSAISEEFKKGLGVEFADTKVVTLHKLQDLRYGENPHQRAALYSQNDKFSFEQLHGKELSYNNILDAFGSWEAANEFDVPACAIFKHVTPCGLGTGDNLNEAFDRAWAADPLSAYGGIISLNKPMTKDIAEHISKVFIEAVCAPDYDEASLEILKQKKNIRILKRVLPIGKKLMFKSVGDEILVNTPDDILFKETWQYVSKRRPSAEEETALKFAWASVKYIKSNAIVLTTENATVGIGAGQMSRVDSVHMAGEKYKAYLNANAKPSVLVLGSDAFFPFADGIEEAAKNGITAVIQPGGSIRDEEVIAKCDELGIAMVFTGLRHFRH
ncbi:phosphoribosylaminoimidazolecarboxamide formyltransferase / IMP cyclohydrolase [Parelusimicrobium proximum]|uniref:bifunctional phosphoribosylaminoimidazolecarboxamide formyltransferase/IMP cyclohydrolase n=1 Tax=Parelusimicrobium proximum TaxID=3228953 RepID=UPI003D17B915